jgi:hypothetical protein
MVASTPHALEPGKGGSDEKAQCQEQGSPRDLGCSVVQRPTELHIRTAQVGSTGWRTREQGLPNQPWVRCASHPLNPTVCTMTF